MIDIDKFIASILSNPKSIIDTSTQFCINEALLEQGLEFRDGSISKVEPSIPEIVEEHFDEMLEDKSNPDNLHQYLYGSNEEEKIRKDIIWCLKHSGVKESNPINPHVTTIAKDAIAWLEKQKDMEAKLIISDEGYNKAFQDGIEEVLTNPHKYGLEKQGEQKPVEWSEEDEERQEETIELLETLIDHPKFRNYATTRCVDWLKSLRPQKQQQEDEQPEYSFIESTYRCGKKPHWNIGDTLAYYEFTSDCEGERVLGKVTNVELDEDIEDWFYTFEDGCRYDEESLLSDETYKKK